MPTGNLPPAGKAIFEKVYESAKKSSTCKDAGDRMDECAARVAWTAVKNAGWHKSGNSWVKSADLEEFSLTIKKAVFDEPTQEMRWRADTSDIDDDSYGDNMTLELFEDFVGRINSNELAPEPFRSEFWKGGMPYLSVSHYPDLNGKAVPGSVDKVYLDGKFLKASGKFHKTPLGSACFDAACKSVYSKDEEDKVRISIAFLDWMHKHKSNGYVFERKDLGDLCPECLAELIKGEYSGRTFLKGQLVHLAQTKVPVNKRTEITAEVDRAMAKTRKDDAESIVGKELADELEQEAKLVGKSEALIIKADEVVEEAQHEDMPNKHAEDTKYPDCMDEKTGEMDQDCVKMHQQKKADLVEEPEEVLIEEATMKKEGGCEHPSSHYLVVEDSTKPTTWHLRFKNCSGEVDNRLLGAAKAALTSPGGHRGNKYAGPGKESATSKLKSLYKKQKLDWESKSEVIKMDGDMPMEYRPYGGATSIKDAKEIQDAREEVYRLQDLWYMLQGIMENIFVDDTIKDKIGAIETAINEFKVFVEQKSFLALSNSISEIKSLLAPKETSAHPLDTAFAELKSEYDKTAAMEATADEKLKIYQQAYANFGRTSAEILQSTVVTKSEPQVASANDLAEMIAKAIAPLAQKVELLTQMSQQKPVQSAVVPEKRSINPALIQESMFAKKPTSETPNLRKLIEATT